MIHGSVELHNVAEAPPMPDGGARLQRVPEAVRACLSEHGRERMLDPAGVEVRFVVEGGGAAVRLHSLGGRTDVQVFFGDFQAGQTDAVGQALTAVKVDLPEWFLSLDRSALGPTTVSPHVCRILLGGGAVCFHGVEGRVRPPRADEVPALRYLAYGTSITQGAGASVRHMSFVAQTARRLGADAINLGSASSAFAEPAMADYIAARRDWHLATLEPTANMLKFSLEEFRRRTAYLVGTVAGADGARPVACLTLMPLAADSSPRHVGPDWGGTPDDFRRAFREVVQASGRPNVRLMEGADLLPDLRDLTTSMIHPSSYGHTKIAEALAARLSGWLASAGGPAAAI
jgi:hypothetical protein